MESFRKTLKGLSASIVPKSKKTRKLRFSKRSKSKSKSKSPSKHSNSRHTSSRSGSQGSKFKKTLRRIHGDLIDIDDLAKKVDTLQYASKQTFSRKKRKTTPESPIILTVKNLDTGKATNATVIKDLNTGKYELYKLSGST